MSKDGNKTVQVRFPDAERTALTTIATARGMTTTELCRKYIRAGAKRDLGKYTVPAPARREGSEQTEQTS